MPDMQHVLRLFILLNLSFLMVTSTGWTFEWRSLNGGRNNLQHPTWGMANTVYARVAPAYYGDGVGAMVEGPHVRYVSNRIFNDLHQNVFSENAVSQWGFVWGQFLDHTFGLRNEAGDAAHLTFDAGEPDPLETFQSDSGSIAFIRSAVAPGTGTDVAHPREQVNKVSSYIDGWGIYGGSANRLEWLRKGPLDDDMSNNTAYLLIDPSGFLPRATARGDMSAAPYMDIGGRLLAAPGRAIIAGDARANENIALNAVHTIFVREHNRIVDALPENLDEETKFQIARKLVGAIQQYITYEAFLPAMGVKLPAYSGYKSDIDATISNEFATVGYRAHSIIHGEIEMDVPVDTYPSDILDGLKAQGVEVEVHGDEMALAVPLNVAFQHPQLLETLGLEPVIAGLAAEAMYNNDEQIDNQLRSILFQMPINPATGERCAPLDGEDVNYCFTEVLDLGAIDIQRGRDHGMPYYNDLREVYGLSRAKTFKDITGESSETFPDDPDIDTNDPINDPDILTFTRLLNGDGQPDEEEPVTSKRLTPLAARLKAIYGDVDRVDAFVGMVSEPHLKGSDLGELQHAIWAKQFQALRDGDRFFYSNDPDLKEIEQTYGLSYRRTLAHVVADNTDLTLDDLPADMFIVAPESADTAGHVAADRP